MSNPTTAAANVVLRTDTLRALRALAHRIAERDGGRRSTSALVQEALDRVLPTLLDEDAQAEAERQRVRMAAALRAARADFLGRFPTMADAETECEPHRFYGITVSLEWDWHTEDFIAEIVHRLADTGMHDESGEIWSDDAETFCTSWAETFDTLDAVTDYPPHERARAAALAGMAAESRA